MEGKRIIAKNSIVLYIRLVVVMIIGLYTSRVVLAALGVRDFGIYQVVDSLVATISILTGTITQTINRFIVFETGKGGLYRQSVVFSTSILLMISIAVIVVILGETVGLWFLNNKINLSSERYIAANWVYQFTILTFIVNLIRVPYNSMLIAHEKMVAYAYFSMTEATLKLALVGLMAMSSYDRLRLYAMLILLLTIFMGVIIGIYCSVKIVGCRFNVVFDKCLIHKFSNFAGINLYGSAIWVVNHQVLAIVLNLFFSTTVNAARGVANQVESLVNSFSQNILTAINPRITKYYASGDYAQARSYICWGVKMSYFLMLFISVPIILECPHFLSFWLVKVPSYSVIFTRLALITAQTQMLISTTTTAIFATGDIKSFVLKIGSIGLLVVPVTYLLFQLGYPPMYAYIVYMVVYMLMIPFRINVMAKHYNMPNSYYYREVVLTCALVTLISLFLPLIVHFYLDASLLKFGIEFFLYIVGVFFSIYYLGFKHHERTMLLNAALKFIRR